MHIVLWARLVGVDAGGADLSIQMAQTNVKWVAQVREIFPFQFIRKGRGLTL